MKISNEWLQSFVNHGLSPEELGHRLTMVGLELDAITPVAATFTGVVVGHVRTVKPHPDADKLRLCEVDDGSGQLQQVVCGAPNVHVDMRAPFARIGAVLPENFAIKKARLRGIESYGMLCSAKELGLSETSDGLLSLPAELDAGSDIRTVLGLDDVVLEVDLTPNRADCLSITGIAREVATLVQRPLSTVPTDPVPPMIADSFPVNVEAREDCPRYAGRVVRGVNPNARTPLWMKERLRRCGIRSLGPLVDITNYVMLELGQPMHAFDLAHLHRAIIVRRARKGESLHLLAGQTIELTEHDLIIADHKAPLALAGIMGGDQSGVDETTVDVFLESAHFAPQAIAGRARYHGLHTDSSHRFERGVDPQLPVHALERATSLLIAIAGGRAGPVQDVVNAQKMAPQAPIAFHPQQVERLLGIHISEQKIQTLLQALGCTIRIDEDHPWQVSPPSFRFDLAITEDLIEEIARLHGYDRLPSEMPPMAANISPKPETLLSMPRIRRRMTDLGYLEAITYSFVDPLLQAMISPDTEGLKLVNPISSEMAVMRTSLWPGLLKAAQYNLHRQQDRIRLFETGLAFIPTAQGLVQSTKIAGLLCGLSLPEQWATEKRKVDFFDLKGDVETLLTLAGLHGKLSYTAKMHPALHPGRSAAIEQGSKHFGWLGALHPELVEKLDLGVDVYLFELDLKLLHTTYMPHYQQQSRFPSIRRDLALLVDQEIPAAKVLAAVREFAPAQVKDIFLFDVYTGTGLPNACKSLALGLILQDLSRTLTDTEVDAIVAEITTQLQQHLGIHLRG